jgi:hypothetical protein
MVGGSHALTSRRREIADLAEQSLGDAIAAEAGADDPQQRIVAAQLASVYRVLFAEGTRRVLAGQPRVEICEALAADAAGPSTCSSRPLAATASERERQHASGNGRGDRRHRRLAAGVSASGRGHLRYIVLSRRRGGRENARHREAAVR